MEKKKVISNSSVLINFSMINRVEVLKILFREIIIPEAVWNEIVIEGKDYPTAKIVKSSDWIKRAKIKNRALFQALSREIDDGEAETIVLALEKNADIVLLDEIEARDIAAYYGLNYIGTIGCLIEAKERKLITSKKPILDEMINISHYWIDETLYTKNP
ncbi:MAG: DUF3368 domain-containing protein [candidate division WOR-3 bacterium]|nr:DUF3368 domain-containing protein [candidate division WOR-3 bacterium]